MTNEPEKLEPIEDDAGIPDETPIAPVEASAEDSVESIEADIVEPELEPVLNTEDLYTNAAPSEEKKAPALTINIASWATPIVGLLMLVIGLAGGYFLRPVISPELAAAPAPTAETAAGPQQQQQQPPQQQEANQPSDEEREALMAALMPQVKHIKGDPNAPITLIEFSDFQWPYCARFATDAGRQITENYVDQGEVRFAYVHFAFLGPESQWSAEASECAGDQDAFWEYHDYLFENHGGENQGAFNQENLKIIAEELGLDTELFNECMDTGKYSQFVVQQTQWAQSLGVQSTPTMVVNGYPVIGAQSFDYFVNLFTSILDR